MTHIELGEAYRRVAEAYIAGLRHRAECGLPLGGIASFATLPTSGGDGATDAHGELFSETALSDLRVVLLRSDERYSGDDALRALTSCPSQQA